MACSEFHRSESQEDPRISWTTDVFLYHHLPKLIISSSSARKFLTCPHAGKQRNIRKLWSPQVGYPTLRDNQVTSRYLGLSGKPQFIFGISAQTEKVWLTQYKYLTSCLSNILLSKESWQLQKTLTACCITTWFEVSGACININRALISNLTQAHHTLKLGFNSVLTHLTEDTITKDLDNFIGYCLAWTTSIIGHHESEVGCSN